MAHLRDRKGKLVIERDLVVNAAVVRRYVMVQMLPIHLPGADEQVGRPFRTFHYLRVDEQQAVYIADLLKELQIVLNRWERYPFSRGLVNAQVVLHERGDQMVHRLSFPFHLVYLRGSPQRVFLDGFFQIFRQTVEARMAHGNRSADIANLLIQIRNVQQPQSDVAVFDKEGSNQFAVRIRRNWLITAFDIFNGIACDGQHRQNSQADKQEPIAFHSIKIVLIHDIINAHYR